VEDIIAIYACSSNTKHNIALVRYGANYANNADCSILVTGTVPSALLSVTFMVFAIERQNDGLQVDPPNPTLSAC
jgi:hypothetical protein